ncbi:hypothetical protein JCM6882_004911 [Rhodosporidiobolus microsporus]
MLDRLPHDLVLYLADHIVPVPTSRNLEQRQETCKVLSLVHRTWTAVAQKKLFEHLPVSTAVGLKKAEGRLAVARLDKRAVKGVEARGPGKVEDSPVGLDDALKRCASLERLVLLGFADVPLSWETTPTLKDLHLNCLVGAGGWLANAPISLVGLPSTLTRLHLQNLMLSAPPPILPSCHTLLVERAVVTLDVPLTASFPALRILGYKGTEGPSVESLSHVANTVQHVHLSKLPDANLISELAAIPQLRSVMVGLTSHLAVGFEGIVQLALFNLRQGEGLPEVHVESSPETPDADYLEVWSRSVV